MNHMKLEIPDSTGTYSLLLYSDFCKKIKVGSLGNLEIKKGYYVYIGSAFGPGGLKSRIGRHLKKNKKLRWHIDYLRKVTEIIDIKFSTDTQRLECEWAAKFAENGGTAPFKGFGSSDCKCFSHLFYFKKKIDLDKMN
jgi:Uri superfamily endonuclease